MLDNADNVIYKNQFAMMAFVLMSVFKLAMLPKYMSIVSGQSSLIVMGIMILLEALMFIVVYYITGRVNIINEGNKWLIAPIMILIFAMSSIRSVVLFSELLDYTTTTLFDQNRYTFIIVVFAPVLAYIVYKGGNTIGRLSEAVFYIIIVLLLSMVILSKVDIEWDRLLPLVDDGGVGIGNGIAKHFLWFGDFIPLLFFRTVDGRYKFLNKYSLPLCLVGSAVFVILFYIGFIGTYAEAGTVVNYAFNRMAIFNKLSELLGTTNFISIMAWLFMALIQLAVLLHSMTVALAYFIKSRVVAVIINVTAIMLVQMYGIQNVDESYVFATSGVQYFLAVVQYLVPVILLIYVKILDKKNKKITDTENIVKYQKSIQKSETMEQSVNSI